MFPQISRHFCQKFHVIFYESARLKTGQMKLTRKNEIRPKNKFTYKDEFKDFRESNEVHYENEHLNSQPEFTERNSNKQVIRGTPAPNLIYIKRGTIPSKIQKKSLLSPLQYKGEIVFGIHPVFLALLGQKRTIFQLFLRTDSETSKKTLRKSEIGKMAKERGISIREVDSKGMKFLAPGVVHQGVCLDAGPIPLPLWQENNGENRDLTHLPFWLVLDEILDPMNVGAVIRSAHYFGVNKLFMVRGNSCRLSPIVSKASSGALEIMDIHQIENLEDFILARKNDGWNIISTITYCEDTNETTGPVVDVADMKMLKPTVLILGNEGRGISVEIQKLCNSFVSIYPKQDLHHGIDSLNVSVAAGVILYALSCQKQKHLQNS